MVKKDFGEEEKNCERSLFVKKNYVKKLSWRIFFLKFFLVNFSLVKYIFLGDFFLVTTVTTVITVNNVITITTVTTVT